MFLDQATPLRKGCSSRSETLGRWLMSLRAHISTPNQAQLWWHKYSHAEALADEIQCLLIELASHVARDQKLQRRPLGLFDLFSH